MKTIKQAAHKILSNSHEQEGVSIDPATLILMVGLLIDIIKILQECQSEPDLAANIVRRPTLKNKRILRRTLRKKFGFFNWKRKKAYCKAIIEYGYEITDEEMELLYGEHRCQNNRTIT